MKTVLITGASSGIGYELAKVYAENGFKVFACGRNTEVLNQLQQRFSSIQPLVFDVTDKHAVLAALPNDIKLDQMVLNAGTCLYIDNPVKFDSEIFEQVIHTNLIATGYCLEAWLPRLTSGSQVGLVSSSASFLPLTRAEAYGASKAGMSYLANTLSIDLAAQHIGVSLIHPGFVKSPLTDKNDFPMPCLVETNDAAQIIYSGMQRKKTEIHFPKRFTFVMKLLALLPFSLWRLLATKMVNS